VAGRYEVLPTEDPIENHLLIDHETQASVALAPGRGGMVTRFRVGDTNVLYMDAETLHDPMKNVRGGIPILFPIAGALRDDQFQEGGKSHALKRHGFARNLPWTIADQSTADAAQMTLELVSSATTRAQFPFDFKLDFTYSLAAGRLTITQRFTNTGEAAMPISPGLHPYFLVLDDRKKEARVQTDATTAYDNRAGRQVTLRAPIDLSASEVDLHLADHWPRTVRLVRPGDRDLDLSLGVPDRILVVWTQRGKDFVCVEPWTAPANALNEGKAIRVPPQGTHETSFSIAVV
jgi:galactose mutarotase-like enzyme